MSDLEIIKGELKLLNKILFLIADHQLKGLSEESFIYGIIYNSVVEMFEREYGVE